jgi:hypothetical protein
MTALYDGAAVRMMTRDLNAGPVFLAGFRANQPTTGVHCGLRVRALVPRVSKAWLALLADPQRQEGLQ